MYTDLFIALGMKNMACKDKIPKRLLIILHFYSCVAEAFFSLSFHFFFIKETVHTVSLSLKYIPRAEARLNGTLESCIK